MNSNGNHLSLYNLFNTRINSMQPEIHSMRRLGEKTRAEIRHRIYNREVKIDELIANVILWRLLFPLHKIETFFI